MHNNVHAGDVPKVSESISIITILANVSIEAARTPLQFRFIQRQHRGGFCDCWAVANLTLIVSNNVEESTFVNLCDQNVTTGNLFHPAVMDQIRALHIDAGFCQDSASVPREFAVQFGSSVPACDNPVFKDTPTDCTKSDQRM